MSGHSKWSTIKRQKGTADAKRGNLFTKLGNSIAIAVREGGGGDPAANFKLRLAVEKAREANMPKDNIQRSIDRGLRKGDQVALQSAVFEGFGPGNVAVMVETITDNTTRTGAELRNVFEKNGGRLAAPGAVAYMFTRVGEIEVGKSVSFDEIFDKAALAGASDVEENPNSFAVFTDPAALHKVKQALASSGLSVVFADLVYQPNKDSLMTAANPDQLDAFVSALDELDDVQEVYLNAR